jgi:hypothetical protein
MVLLGVSLCGVVSGCGFVERVVATPTITELPSEPDAVTPTAPVDGASGSVTPGPTVTPDAPAGAKPSATPDRSRWPDPAPLQPTERLVVVDTLGIGFAAPTLATEIDPEEYVEGSAALDELSRVMGLSPSQVRTGLLNQIDRMVTGVGDDGRMTSLVVARVATGELPTEELIRQGLGVTMNGDVTRVSRPATPAGTAVHAVYRLGTAGDYHYGEAVYLETPEAVASVTVTAGSAAEARRLGGRVLATLRVIE